MSGLLKKIATTTEKEDTILKEYFPIVNEKNLDILKVVLFANIIIFVINFLLTFLGSKFDTYLRLSYIVLIVICAFIYFLLNKCSNINSFYAIYAVYIVGTIYCITSSGFIYPDFVSVMMLALIFQIPILYVDKTWRLNLFVIVMSIIYLLAIAPFKESVIFIDEIINIFSFSLISLLIGSFTRMAKFENYSMKSILQGYAYSDQLTKLSNRRQLFEDFTQNNAVDNNHVTGLAIIDIDDFKNYNDTYGHQAGDDCLCAVSECFLSYQNNYNVHFYRYGGEEFLVSFKDYSKSDALEISNKLRVSIELLQIPHVQSLRGVVTVSIGLAFFNQNENQKYELLISKADKALYTAKRTGKNTVVYGE